MVLKEKCFCIMVINEIVKVVYIWGVKFFIRLWVLFVLNIIFDEWIILWLLLIMFISLFFWKFRMLF